MNVNSVISYIARLAPFDSNRRVDIFSRARSGDTEVQVQEKANGEREVVVLQRVAAIDVSEFEADESDLIECPHCGADNHRGAVEHHGCCHDCREDFLLEIDCPHCEETVNALDAIENERLCPNCDGAVAPELVGYEE